MRQIGDRKVPQCVLTIIVQCTTLSIMPRSAAHELTSSQVCEELNISRPTLSRWVRGGRINPTRKMPGLRGPYLFDPREVRRVRIQTQKNDTAVSS